MGDKRLSISELVQKLKKGEIDSKELDKKVLWECARRLKREGFSWSEIASIFKTTERTAQRYLKKAKEEITLNLKNNFQLELAGEMLNNWRSRIQRLQRLLDSGKLSAFEEARVVLMAQKIEEELTEMFVKLGYFSKAQGDYDQRHAGLNASEIRERRAMGKRWMLAKKLTPDQRRSIADYYSHNIYQFPFLEKEIRKRTDEMLDKYMAENEILRKSKTRPVTSFSRLSCKLFVVNKLCNN